VSPAVPVVVRVRLSRFRRGAGDHLADDRQALVLRGPPETAMDKPAARIAVLGASGLIGEATARTLALEGFAVVPMARRFSASQRAAFGAAGVECPIVALDADALERIFAEQRIDVVVNCIGVLQDGPRGGTEEVHRAFVERLLRALAA